MTSTPGWDPIWEKIFKELEWGKYPSEHVVRFVARNFYKAPDRSKVRLFDLGCGTGTSSLFMAREGFEVHGIDGSETAIQRVNNSFKAEGLRGTFKTGDFVALPWDDNMFDGAVENVALCCNPFSRCKMAVAEILRILKPGGLFQSCNFTNRSWGFESGVSVGKNEYSSFADGPLHERGFGLLMDRDQIDELYSGFDDVVVEKMSRTGCGQKHLIEWWLVECRKPA